MGKYRKKPVVIEAVKWEAKHYDGPEWFIDALHNDDLREIPVNPTLTKLRVITLEGHIMADPGDWIIRGVAGEIYPCKPHIFEQTYEQVD